MPDNRALPPDSNMMTRQWSPTAFISVMLVCSFIVTAVMALAGRTVVFGSSTVRLVDEGGAVTALARRAVQAQAVEGMTTEQLRQISARLQERASEGDPQAALFVFEVAALQRAAEAKVGQNAPSLR